MSELELLLIATAALAVFCLILLILVIVALVKVGKQKKRYDKFMEKAVNTENGTLDSLIDGIINQVDDLHVKNSELKKELEKMKFDMKYCGQKISIMRYNAFDNVGSDQSFSIALLDENDNGFVITGIYARDNSSTYAKPIIAGDSRYQLSAEEKAVVQSAREEYNKRILKREK